MDDRPASGKFSSPIAPKARPRSSRSATQRDGSDQQTSPHGGPGARTSTLKSPYLAVAGKADFGGGLVWHAVDDRNYYLLRVSLIEQKLFCTAS